MEYVIGGVIGIVVLGIICVVAGGSMAKEFEKQIRLGNVRVVVSGYQDILGSPLFVSSYVYYTPGLVMAHTPGLVIPAVGQPAVFPPVVAPPLVHLGWYDPAKQRFCRHGERMVQFKQYEGYKVPVYSQPESEIEHLRQQVTELTKQLEEGVTNGKR